MNELLFEPISSIGEQLRTRAVSSVELVTAALEQIAATDAQLNAFPVVKAEEALARAEAADAELAQGGWRGPLHGIPVGVKDNIAVEGWVTTCGSPILAEHVTDFDAAVVERLRNAGAVVLGKNNMHEWALAGSCIQSIFGSTHNPWNMDHITGGSSGGSAAAVASGQAFVSIGTDARASIRNPASYCGVVGLKPTHGLVSRFGELPPTSSWYMTLGPIARRVEDVALTMDAIAGYDSRDPSSVEAERREYAARLEEGVRGLRIAVVTNYFYNDTLPEVAASVRAAADALASLGAEVVEVEIEMLEHWPLIESSFEGENKGWLLDLALERGDDFLHDDIRYRILASAFTNTVDTMRSTRILSMLRHEVQDLMRDTDLLLTPTNSTPAYRTDARDVAVREGTVDVEAPGGQGRITTRLTVPFNALALPAISVPCGFSGGGLPIGLQLVGRAFEDDLVLRAARAYEQVGPGYQRPPVVR